WSVTDHSSRGGSAGAGRASRDLSSCACVCGRPGCAYKATLAPQVSNKTLAISFREFVIFCSPIRLDLVIMLTFINFSVFDSRVRGPLAYARAAAAIMRGGRTSNRLSSPKIIVGAASQFWIY